MALPARTEVLRRLTSERFDLVVVGGGITGCCIARDAARRGLRVALVDASDFSGGTSAATSRLIHGGLRYLKNFQVGVVRESLRERRVWGVIAAGAVQPSPFLLPTFGVANDAWMRLALTAYDTLAFDRNRGVADDARIPASRHLSRTALLTRAPVLERPGVTGGLMYHDTVSEGPERLALACLDDAAAHGAVCVNYVRAVARPAADQLELDDTVTSTRLRVNGTSTVIAAGPWTDRVATSLGATTVPRLTRSKGIHLITRRLSDEALLVPVEGRHFFVIPWHDRTLIGTTDTPYLGDPDHLGVTEEEIHDFLRTINVGLPQAKLSRDDVTWAYAGLRPLASTGGNTYKASRRSDIALIAPSLWSVIGGKWTTSRAVAEQCVDRMAREHGRPLAPCTTATAVLPWEPAAVPGDAADEAAAIERALRDEMAHNLGDIVFRRTHLAILTAHLPIIERAQHARRWADLVASHLGWSEARRDADIHAFVSACRRVSMWPA